MKKTSIVILNWNGAALLKQFLPTVLIHTQTADCEVVVADNNSSDNSIALLKEHFPSVKLILLDKNYGFAEGYNRALQQVHSTYVVLLNSDVETSPNWLAPLIEYLERNPNIAAVQPKILSYNDKTKFEYAGAAGGYIDRYAYPFCRGRILNVLEEDRGQYDNVEQIFWASGACLCIRRADYMKAGGLDSDFFAHMEEIDLCWRLQSRGKKIVFVPQSHVYHVGGASLNSESPRKTHLNFRNNLLMIYKNMTLPRMIETMIVRIVLDAAAAAHFLVQRKFTHAQAVVNAYSDFIKMRPAFKHKRKENLAKTIQPKLTKQYSGSILLDFYLHKKKRFSDIIASR
ncbi:MAG: glycosyltransferase family 2 protein [Dysgonamonadaceae bacterium]|nr:glycosyltransferase family 2 protein [Dysgonamonadaceae bacterium]MDD3355732.1 glycosyltransferase family 2 protein [Dysgonamonadaceae bacterium]